jgi:death on curing protein
MNDPIFRTLDQVLRLHARQINELGGSEGVRDIELIKSAIAQPQLGSGGEYFHKSIAEMAAAYLFHLVKNHGFVDGNKRVGADAALTFPELNGVDTDTISEEEMGELTLAIAEGNADKRAAASFFRQRLESHEES